MKRTVVAMGLQKTGKTTFLAAFWDVVRSGHVVGSLRMQKTYGDMQYLNEIRDAWADCNEITRTGPASDKPVSMLLEDTTALTTTELAWTDMLGESFERQWTERAWTQAYQVLADEAVGIVLFVHPKKLRESQLIINALKAAKGVAQPKPVASAEVPAAQQPTGAEAPPKPEPFEKRLVPTQVVLVDLLQNLDSQRATGDKLRVSIVVSAWDVIDKAMRGKMFPEEWVRKSLPLLDQYLTSNDDRFMTMVFGVSAQGGDLSDAATLRKVHQRASDKIKVRFGTTVSQDVTAPVRWAIGSAVS
jgi:hypothetical protein